MLGIGSLPRLWPNRAEPIKPNTIMNNQEPDVIDHAIAITLALICCLAENIAGLINHATRPRPPAPAPQPAAPIIPHRQIIADLMELSHRELMRLAGTTSKRFNKMQLAAMVVA
jgi:hypothetical protein